MKKTHEALTARGSAFDQYRDVIVGRRSLGYLLLFELCQLFTYVPGALGMALRKIFWPRLFHSCGRGVLFGSGVTLRHPGRIILGDRVVISDGCILDGRHDDREQTIRLGAEVMLSNDVMLSCKGGSIEIGDNVGINAQSIIQSTNGCPVSIGADVIIGQRCFIVGGGSYNTDDLDRPIRLQGIKDDGGVVVEDNVWLGAGVTVLGGVRVGHGSILAASTVMTASVEPFSVCKGIPARVTANRRDDS